MFDSHQTHQAHQTQYGYGAPAGSAPLQPSQELNILDRLAAVYKHRRIVTTVFLFVVAVMMVDSYTTTPMYKAQARLLIEDERYTSWAQI